MRNQPCHQACGEDQPCTGLEPLPSAKDEDDFAEQLGSGNWRIRCELRVAPSDQTWIFGITGPRHHAMSYKPALPGEEHDIAREDFGDILPVRQKNVTGPHRGKHAAPGDSETQGTKRAGDFRRKFALRGVQGSLRGF
jgi:hypothetical protein